MAASLSGAIKAVIEGAGLGLSAHRDEAPSDVGVRFVTIDESIVVTTEHLGDDGTDDPVTEIVQVNLWQPWRAEVVGDAAEDYALPGQLHAVLHGSRLTEAPTLVRSCTVDDVARILELDSNVVHHAFTLRIRRER